MAASKDVVKDIARIALREDRRFPSEVLEEVFAYCWDQLGWLRSEAELLTLRQSLQLENDEAA